MVFSSAVFLFAFLPIVFILHTVIRNTTVRNILLIVASLLFYACIYSAAAPVDTG